MVDAAVAATATTVAAALPAPTISLVIDTKAKRVLFAEAGKEAVDFLYSILATSIGTAARLLRDDGAQPCGAASMYDSAEKMDPVYMKSPAVRDALLNSHRYTLLQNPTIGLNHWPGTGSTVPAASTFVHGTTMTTTAPTHAPSMPVLWASRPPYAAVTAPTSVPRGCPSCGCPGGCSSPGGFVQGMMTYTVMDDLTIAPRPKTSLMVLLRKLIGEGKDKDLVLLFSSIEEKSVQLGAKEGLDILKASLQSNTVLTDVFLSKNTTDVSVSKNKRARTSSGEKNPVQEKIDKIPDYYI